MNAYHNIDCMEGMKEFPDKYFELAIVDPPYNISNNASRHGGSGKLKNRILNKGSFKMEVWDKVPTKEYFTELFRISKHQIICGGNYFPLPPTRGIICWDKYQPFENFSRWEMLWTSFDCPAKMFGFDNRTKGKIHPTEKPIELYEWLLKHYAKQGDKILDTHVGSGSSIIAFEKHGFEYCGYEIDKDYYDSSKKRIEKHRELLQQEVIFK